MVRDRVDDDFSDTIPTQPMPLAGPWAPAPRRTHVLGSAGSMRLAADGPAPAPIAAHSATEVGAPEDEDESGAPRVPRLQPGSFTLIWPVLIVVAIAALAALWHMVAEIVAWIARWW